MHRDPLGVGGPAQAVAEVDDLVKMLENAITPEEWHLISRRSSSWTLPTKIKGYTIEEERRLLEPDTDLIHLTFRSKT